MHGAITGTAFERADVEAAVEAARAARDEARGAILAPRLVHKIVRHDRSVVAVSNTINCIPPCGDGFYHVFEDALRIRISKEILVFIRRLTPGDVLVDAAHGIPVICQHEADFDVSLSGFIKEKIEPTQSIFVPDAWTTLNLISFRNCVRPNANDFQTFRDALVEQTLYVFSAWKWQVARRRSSSSRRLHHLPLVPSGKDEFFATELKLVSIHANESILG